MKKIRQPSFEGQIINVRVRTARIVKLNQKQIGKIMPKQVQKMAKESLKRLINQQYLFLKKVEYRKFLWNSMPQKPFLSPYILRLKKRAVFLLQQVINIFFQLENKIIKDEKQNTQTKQDKIMQFVENFEFHINELIQQLQEESKNIFIDTQNMLRLIISKELRNSELKVRSSSKRLNKDEKRRKNIREDSSLSRFSRSRKVNISSINLINTQLKSPSSNVINRQTVRKMRQQTKKTDAYKSEFRDLVKKVNIFNVPESLQHAYKNKKMEFYNLQEDQMQQKMQETHQKAELQVQKSIFQKFSVQQIQFIQGWIQEIDLSSQLFQQKAINVFQFYDYSKSKQQVSKQLKKRVSTVNFNRISKQQSEIQVRQIK